MDVKRLDDVLGNLFPRFKREYDSLTGISLDAYKMPMANKENWWCVCGCKNEITDIVCSKCDIKLNELKCFDG